VIDVASVTYNNSTDTLTVTVTNNGTTALSVEDTSLLVDNEYEIPNSTAVDGDGDTDVWAPDQSLVVTVDIDPTPDRVKVVAENGVAASNTTVEEVS
jgi:flagellar protein FlaF